MFKVQRSKEIRTENLDENLDGASQKHQQEGQPIGCPSSLSYLLKFWLRQPMIRLDALSLPVRGSIGKPGARGTQRDTA
jgi:hypothetical protein